MVPEYSAGAYTLGSTGSRVTLPPGYQLVNPTSRRSYLIQRVLGGGGFGVTYEALSQEGRKVAVKEFFPVGITVRSSGYAITIIGDEKTAKSRLQSFIKEAQVLSTLKGLSCVVEIFDSFYANQTAYYVMEYIDGITMLDYLQRVGLLKPKMVDMRFRELMEALEILHNHGVIHRDISPDNIMIRRDGSFKLIDFGSARAFGGQQNLTVNVKRNFAPLEQYSESGQGRYTDVYSLAATMYYAFTGKLVPFGKGRIDTGGEVTIALLNAGLEMVQAESILKALSVKPAGRYQSMQEFELAFFGSVKTKAPANEPEPATISVQIRQSLRQLKKKPVYPIVGGACFALALFLQLLL